MMEKANGQMGILGIGWTGMRIVILGSEGMLGNDLVETGRSAGIEVTGYGHSKVDISKEDSGLEKLPECDWVINCAAYTDVDGAGDKLCGDRRFLPRGHGLKSSKMAQVVKGCGRPRRS